MSVTRKGDRSIFLVDGLILEKSEKVWNGNKRVVSFSSKFGGKGEGKENRLETHCLLV